MEITTQDLVILANLKERGDYISVDQYQQIVEIYLAQFEGKKK